MLSIKENTIANKRGRFVDECLSLFKKFRTELMGFAIIWIMLFHGEEFYKGLKLPIFTFVIGRGNVGVDIFLFLSGFGLYYSLNANKDTISFYRRRIIRVLIPYLLISVPYWIYNTVRKDGSALDFFSNLTGVSFVTKGVPTTWYIFLIIFLYIAYPFVFKIEREYGLIGDVMLIFSSIVISLLIYNLNIQLYHNIEIALTRIPCFIFGSLSARLYEKKRKIDNTFFIMYTIISIGIFGLSAFMNSKDHLLAVMMYRYGSAGAGLIAMYVCCIFLTLFEKRIRLLNILGGVSLELYLLHIFIRHLLKNNDMIIDRYETILNCFIWFGAIAVTIICGIVFHNIYKKGIDFFAKCNH